MTDERLAEIESRLAQISSDDSPYSQFPLVAYDLLSALKAECSRVTELEAENDVLIRDNLRLWTKLEGVGGLVEKWGMEVSTLKQMNEQYGTAVETCVLAMRAKLDKAND
jgi:hypothetical protein